MACSIIAQISLQVPSCFIQANPVFLAWFFSAELSLKTWISKGGFSIQALFPCSRSGPCPFQSVSVERLGFSHHAVSCVLKNFRLDDVAARQLEPWDAIFLDAVLRWHYLTCVADQDAMHRAKDVVFLQGVCSHDPRTGGAGMGEFSTRSKTRFSFRPQDGKTSLRRNMILDKSRALCCTWAARF